MATNFLKIDSGQGKTEFINAEHISRMAYDGQNLEIHMVNGQTIVAGVDKAKQLLEKLGFSSK